MSQELDIGLFSGFLKTKRADRGLREVANEIGDVSASTLSRIEQGRLPDVETFIKLCKWMEVSPEKFYIHKELSNLSNQEIAIAHLRADKELSKDTLEMIVKMINFAYNK